jgi:NitT/TauT family transport system permease protein
MAARTRAVSGFPEPLVLGTAGLAIFIALWELAAEHDLINPTILASPSRIAAAFAAQWSSGQLVADLSVSLSEFALGFALSVAVGVFLGIAMGLNRDVEYALDPFMWFLYSAPLIAIYPLIVVWMGFGFATVVTVVFLLTVVSIVVNTLAGVQSVDPVLIRAVRAFGGTRRDVVVKVILPASMPLILTGLRIGVGRALIGVVLGEMFGANAGLGFRMTVYAAHLRTADVFVPLVVFIALGVASTQLIGLLERRLQAWKGRAS